ncbi:MAG: hypothetical protein NT062_24330 [Proteobacteria bacterium]|nr:hypothetical protein [Pseudomonadota bacterium]
MAPLRAGKTPTGPIPILRADGSTAQLEIARGVVTRWPTWTTTTSGWREVVAAKRAAIATHRLTATATLATARTALADADLTAVQATLRTRVTTIADALATAVAEADGALEALPGTEAAELGELRALRARLATSHAHATLAAHVLELADPTREVHAIFDDALGQIAP